MAEGFRILFSGGGGLPRMITVLWLTQAAAQAEAIGWWRLDGTTSNAVTNAYHGTITGTDYAWIPGVAGQALSINPTTTSTTCMGIGNHAAFDFGTNDFAVSVWVNKRATSSAWLHAFGVAQWDTGSHAGANEWAILTTSNGGDNKPSFNIESGTSTYAANAPSNITLNVFHHIVAVRSGPALKLYVDGTFVAENSSLGTKAVNNVGRNLFVGDSDLTVKNYRPNAAFDDLQIYNTALSDGGVTTGQQARAEIRFLYEHPGKLCTLRGTTIALR